MDIWTSAYRTSNRHSVAAIVRATIVTGLAPAIASGSLLWFVPEACVTSSAPPRYLWTCLLPWLLIVVPAGVAIVLATATTFNQRRTRPFFDGWLVIVLAMGVLTQTILVGAYLIALGPGYFLLGLVQAFFVPQPFVAGSLAGAVFWTTLHWGQTVQAAANDMDTNIG